MTHRLLLSLLGLSASLTSLQAQHKLTKESPDSIAAENSSTQIIEGQADDSKVINGKALPQITVPDPFVRLESEVQQQSPSSDIVEAKRQENDLVITSSIQPVSDKAETERKKLFKTVAELNVKASSMDQSGEPVAIVESLSNSRIYYIVRIGSVFLIKGSDESYQLKVIAVNQSAIEVIELKSKQQFTIG